MKNENEIVSLYVEREKSPVTSARRAAMRLFEQFIRDEIDVPLPEVDRAEKSAIANLAAQGLMQESQRIGSLVPGQEWPTVRPGIDLSEVKARKRRQAAMGWWEHNDMQAVLTLRAEYLLGHGMAPVTVLPDPATGIPIWRVRDPIQTFPAPCANPLDITPDDCLFAYQQSWGWLRRRYGTRVMGLARPDRCSDDYQLTIVEYVDEDQIAMVAMAGKDPQSLGTVGTDRAVMLENLTNRASCELVFVPNLYGLGGIKGKFDGTIGIHQMRAKLVALAYITASKGALPDTWLESIDGLQVPAIDSPPDHREGVPGVISGGKLHVIDVNPGFTSTQMQATLERELRLAGGIPAAFGGEASSTVQTGRMASNLLSSAIDFPIQQAQRKFERSLALENKAAVAIVKQWTPGPRSFYVSWKGAKGVVDYDPATDFETDNNVVRYPLAGSDLNNELLRSQQKVATGMWSKRTAREMDPETQDAEREHDRVVVEAIEQSVLVEFLQPGSMDVTAKAQVMALVASGKMELPAAIEKVHAEQQAAQAAAAASEAGAADTMSGLNALPPAVAGGVQPAIPQGPPSLDNLAMTARTLAHGAPQAARPVSANAAA